MARNSKPSSPIDIDATGHPEDDGVLSPGPGKESFKIAQYWKSQVNSYETATRKWNKKGNAVVKRFRDERNRNDEEGSRRMNLLWANYKVMKPAIYSRCPDPVVDRKFLDRDPTGRLSAQMLERTLRNELEPSGYHDSISMAVDDRLLPGKGVVWCRYVPEIGEGTSIPAPTKNGVEDGLDKIDKEFNGNTKETDQEEQLEESDTQVVAEKIEVDYVDWHDFMYFPVKARTWKEVQAIGKVVHISKKEAIERFGEKIGKALKPDTEPTTMGDTDRQGYSDTAVFQDINERNITINEIWNKSDRKAYWTSPSYDYLCDVVEDPLELTEFFPTPAPLMSTKTNDTLIPVPDFIEWQDQAVQIDELTQRIAMLSKACKVAGAYNAAMNTINRIFEESVENQLIPIDQWAMFAEAGGLKGNIDFIPLDQIQAAIETLQGVRQQCMIDLDQITGLSDIVRGTSDSRETLGGIRLKNNNAGTRLSESQEEVARFARDTLKIMAEIVCKHFSDETIIESSGILYEDALQPDTVMRELQDPQVSADSPNNQSQRHLGSPQGMQLAAGSNPQTPPMGGGQVPGAPMAPTQAGASSAPQAPPGNNVIPFPGAPGQAPPMGMPIAPPIDPQTIIMMKVMKALKLLREDVKRNYRIDIETDSTIFGDKEQDKANVNEFLTALGGYMKQLESAIQFPESLSLFAKALQWGIRRYRTGRDLEAEVDAFCEAVQKKAKEMIANPQQSPEDKKAAAEIQKMQQQGQLEAANDQRESQRQAENDQREMAIEQQKNSMEMEKEKLSFALAQEENANKREIMQMEMAQMREKHKLEIIKIRAEMVQSHQEHLIEKDKIVAEKEKASHEVSMSKEEHKIDKQELNLDKQTLEHKKKEHTHKMKVQKQQSQKKRAS